MQRTIYECDHCKHEVDEVMHVTLAVGQNGHASGVAYPPDMPLEQLAKIKGLNAASGGWRVKGFPRNFLHLHLWCILPFFSELAGLSITNIEAMKKLKPVKRRSK